MQNTNKHRSLKAAFALKHFLLVCLVLITASEACALDAIVYVISGGPFDTGGSDTDSYGHLLTAVGNGSQGSTLSLNRKHNSHQSEVCQDIIQQKKAHPEAKVIVAGHSYGGDAGIWVSKCLEGNSIFVDLLLTMDTVARNMWTVQSSLTVPDNVQLNYHFYQRHDPMLKGSGYNRRHDRSQRGIFNFRQNYGSTPVQSHLSVINRLNDYQISSLLIVGVIANLTEEQLQTSMKPYLDRFFLDFPTEDLSKSKSHSAGIANSR